MEGRTALARQRVTLYNRKLREEVFAAYNFAIQTLKILNFVAFNFAVQGTFGSNCRLTWPENANFRGRQISTRQKFLVSTEQPFLSKTRSKLMT